MLTWGMNIVLTTILYIAAPKSDSRTMDGGVAGGPAGPNNPVACCQSDGSCQILGFRACVRSGGVPHPGANCNNITCSGTETGACCLGRMGGTQGCVQLPGMACQALGGTFHGNGSTCGNPTQPGPCPPPAFACCRENGTCVSLPANACLEIGGTPHIGQSCNQVQCQSNGLGACCVTGGGINGCLMVPESLCQNLMGQFQGPNSTCGNDPTHPTCPPPARACCLPDGVCIVAPLAQCLGEGGIPQNALTCSNVQCSGNPATGACCTNLPGIPPCVVVTPQQCANFGGAYQGNGTTCSGDPMNPTCGGGNTIPCCVPSPIPEGTCVELSLAACLAQSGQPHPNAPSCMNVQCMPPLLGACCVATPGAHACLMLSEMQCAQSGGDFLGHGTTCNDNPANPPCGGGNLTRACCLPNGACEVLPTMVCINLQGVPQNSFVCAGILCGDHQTHGACCTNSPGIPPCLVTSPLQCAQINGSFQGAGTTCSGDPMNPTCSGPVVPCCLPAPIPEGICQMLPLNQCLAMNGQPRPDAASCAFVQCMEAPDRGACCLSGIGNVGCLRLTAEQCDCLNGEYLGNGTFCGGPNNPNPCADPPALACCLPNGLCTHLPPEICVAEGGTPQNSTMCPSIFCGGGPATGACCRNLNGAPGCVEVTAQQCASVGGEYRGDNTSCAAGPGQPPLCGGPNIACCLSATGACIEVPLQQCLAQGGQPHTTPSCMGVTCGGGPAIGACCISNGQGGFHCLMMNQATCSQLNGEFQGNGTQCPNSPSLPGPCHP